MVVSILSGLVVVAVVGALAWARQRAGARLARRHPINISVERIVREPWALAFRGPTPDCNNLEGVQMPTREANARLRACGGIDFGTTRLRLRLRGAATETVTVRNIGAEIHREPAADGCLVFCPTAGANAATVLLVDLDDADAAPWLLHEDVTIERVGASPYFDTHNITLAPGEVHDLVVIGTTKKWYCIWRLKVDIEVGGHFSTVVVDDDGAPFRTTGEPSGGFGQKLLWAWWEGGRLKPDDEAM